MTIVLTRGGRSFSAVAVFNRWASQYNFTSLTQGMIQAQQSNHWKSEFLNCITILVISLAPHLRRSSSLELALPLETRVHETDERQYDFEYTPLTFYCKRPLREIVL